MSILGDETNKTFIFYLFYSALHPYVFQREYTTGTILHAWNPEIQHKLRFRHRPRFR